MVYDQKVKEEWIVSLVETLDKNRSLYLVGTSLQGPLNAPIQVRSLEQAMYHFGCQGTLIEAYQQIEPLIHDVEVTLVKTNGAHARLSLRVNQEWVEDEAFELISVHANALANEIQVELDPDCLHIIHPASLGGHRVTYRLEDYGVLGDLAKAINLDAELGKISVCAICYHSEWVINCPFYPCNPSLMNLEGGRDDFELTPEAYYLTLEQTYDTLIGVEVDVIVPIKAYIDTTSIGIDYYQQLKTFCLSQIEHGCFTHGVIGLNVIEGETEQQKCDRLAKLSILANRTNETFDECSVVSVVVTEVYYNYLAFADNGYLAYGAILSLLPPNQNSTNQPLHESIQLKERVRLGIESEWASLGFVSFRYSPLKVAPVVTLDVTFTNGTTGLKYYHNLRMCQDVCLMVKQLVDGYVGSPMTDITENARLQQELDYLMYQLSSKGVVKEYNFHLQTDSTTHTLYLDLELKTRYMVSSISIYGDLLYRSV